VERPAGVAGLPIALAGAEHDAVASLDAERRELTHLVAGTGPMAMTLPFFGFTFVLSDVLSEWNYFAATYPKPWSTSPLGADPSAKRLLSPPH
jgi:hypothetical protein